MIQAKLLSRRAGPSARWVLPWLFLVALSLTSAARGGGGPGASGSPDGSTNTSSPGDEVTSLPMVQEQSGLTFVGTPRALRMLDAHVAGRGRITTVRIGGGQIAVTLTGDYRVELDRVALASGEVTVLFRGGRAFEGGIARLEVGSSSPVFLAPDRVPLPVGRIAANARAQGTLVVLDVAARRHGAHLEADFGRETVTLFQRID